MSTYPTPLANRRLVTRYFHFSCRRRTRYGGNPTGEQGAVGEPVGFGDVWFGDRR
jgi:hypothetical protein